MKINDNKFKILIISIGLVIFISITALSIFMYSNKGAPISWNMWEPINVEAGTAIYGYDVVAYHTDNKAIRGNQSYSYRWKQANWFFSSPENLTTFQQNPEKFSPQFGGYCATAVSAGITFESNPLVWHIENEKLYLFYDEAAKQDWIGQLNENIIETGNNNWSKRHVN